MNEKQQQKLFLIIHFIDYILISQLSILFRTNMAKIHLASIMISHYNFNRIPYEGMNFLAMSIHYIGQLLTFYNYFWTIYYSLIKYTELISLSMCFACVVSFVLYHWQINSRFLETYTLCTLSGSAWKKICLIK